MTFLYQCDIIPRVMKNTPKYSIVVPIFNEAGNITRLDAELQAMLATLDGESEIIYVNDGSKDDSEKELASLSGVTVITLMRQYGQATALDAGLRRATGEFIITLDGDGQNDPADIPRLISARKEKSLDVVAGYRKSRKDKGGIRILTVIGRNLRRIILEDTVHDTGCTLRIYTREAAKSLDIGGEMHRYILALLKWKGFRIGEIVVNDRARVHGVSKYNYTKAVRGFIDLVYMWFIHKYYQRPLHLFGYLSFALFLVSMLLLGNALYQKIFFDLAINRSGHFLLGSFSLLTAVILFSFGIVIDLLMRIHLNNSPHEKRYYVRRVEEK